MGVIRNTASMQIRGKVGNTTYYVEGGRQIARVSQNGSNYGESASRTEKQQFQRGKWGNLVNFYKVSKSWMRKAFESKKRTQSDYNRFMQLNTTNARIYLTRNMYANGGCVADAFRISEGSLRPINVVTTGAAYMTDLAVSSSAFEPDDSVAALTEELLENNNHLREGMQISFISYQQRVTAEGVPSLVCTAYEMTLDLKNDAPFRTYLPEFCSQSVDGYLGTSTNISTGAFAYVLSETRNGKTYVSTQSLITKNDTLINMYSSADAIEASIKSYGVDADIFLTSGSYPTGATPQPLFIEKIRWESEDGVILYKHPGDNKFPIGTLFDGTSDRQLVISGGYVSFSKARVNTQSNGVIEVTTSRASNGNISLGSIPSTYFPDYILGIDITINDATYSIDFKYEIE